MVARADEPGATRANLERSMLSAGVVPDPETPTPFAAAEEDWRVDREVRELPVLVVAPLAALRVRLPTPTAVDDRWVLPLAGFSTMSAISGTTPFGSLMTSPFDPLTSPFDPLTSPFDPLTSLDTRPSNTPQNDTDVVRLRASVMSPDSIWD